jgi:dTMP kinase
LAKKKGLFVTLEGPDGVGKSTQARLLAAALKRKGRRVTVTREPGGSVRCARIRALVLDPALAGLDAGAELLLFAADRRQHVADTIRPALERGDLVLCDRFTDSTAAYQGAGRILKPGAVSWISDFASTGLVPDLTLLYDLPLDAGLERARQRGRAKDRMEAADRNYFSRVRAGFLSIARKEPRRVKTIKVQGLGPEAVCAEGLRLMAPLLERR